MAQKIYFSQNTSSVSCKHLCFVNSTQVCWDEGRRPYTLRRVDCNSKISTVEDFFLNQGVGTCMIKKCLQLGTAAHVSSMVYGPLIISMVNVSKCVLIIRYALTCVHVIHSIEILGKRNVLDIPLSVYRFHLQIFYMNVFLDTYVYEAELEGTGCIDIY